MSDIQAEAFWEGIYEEQIDELEGEDELEDEEYRKGECPSCRKIFADDYDLLNHICKEKLAEY